MIILAAELKLCFNAMAAGDVLRFFPPITRYTRIKYSKKCWSDRRQRHAQKIDNQPHKSNQNRRWHIILFRKLILNVCDLLSLHLKKER